MSAAMLMQQGGQLRSRSRQGSAARGESMGALITAVEHSVLGSVVPDSPMPAFPRKGISVGADGEAIVGHERAVSRDHEGAAPVAPPLGNNGSNNNKPPMTPTRRQMQHKQRRAESEERRSYQLSSGNAENVAPAGDGHGLLTPFVKGLRPVEQQQQPQQRNSGKYADDDEAQQQDSALPAAADGRKSGKPATKTEQALRRALAMQLQTPQHFGGAAGITAAEAALLAASSGGAEDIALSPDSDVMGRLSNLTAGELDGDYSAMNPGDASFVLTSSRGAEQRASKLLAANAKNAAEAVHEPRKSGRASSRQRIVTVKSVSPDEKNAAKPPAPRRSDSRGRASDNNAAFSDDDNGDFGDDYGGGASDDDGENAGGNYELPSTQKNRHSALTASQLEAHNKALPPRPVGRGSSAAPIVRRGAAAAAPAAGKNGNKKGANAAAGGKKRADGAVDEDIAHIVARRAPSAVASLGGQSSLASNGSDRMPKLRRGGAAAAAAAANNNIKQQAPLLPTQQQQQKRSVSRNIVQQQQQQQDGATAAALRALTIPQLKERLRALGLSVGGKKEQLVQRILYAEGKQRNDDDDGDNGDYGDDNYEYDDEDEEEQQAPAAPAGRRQAGSRRGRSASANSQQQKQQQRPPMPAAPPASIYSRPQPPQVQNGRFGTAPSNAQLAMLFQQQQQQQQQVRGGGGGNGNTRREMSTLLDHGDLEDIQAAANIENRYGRNQNNNNQRRGGKNNNNSPYSDDDGGSDGDDAGFNQFLNPNHGVFQNNHGGRGGNKQQQHHQPQQRAEMMPTDYLGNPIVGGHDPMGSFIRVAFSGAHQGEGFMSSGAGDHRATRQQQQQVIYGASRNPTHGRGGRSKAAAISNAQALLLPVSISSRRKTVARR